MTDGTGERPAEAAVDEKQHPQPDTDAFGADVRAEADGVIARYPESRSALLPLLHLVQSVQGHVSEAGVAFCAERLGLGTAEVSAVATFYTMYKDRPCGQHLVSVCTNTLCAALGGDEIYRRVTGELGVGHEETAGEPGETGSLTVEHAECLAACDLAPVVQVNYEYYDKQTPESALDLVRALQRGEKPTPSRGAPLSDFRTVERELAGFYADLEAEAAGGTSSAETLRGAELARQRGWSAPAKPDPDSAEAALPPLPEKN
ncbi:NADH-quinone oxidoreductase subunit NuoE [Bounagaea algeriensis]